MDDESPPARPRWLPVTVLGAGTLLVAAPLVYLWRAGKPHRISLRAATASPPRRSAYSALSFSAPAASVSVGPSRFPLPVPEFPAAEPSAPPPALVSNADWDDDADWGVPQPPPDPNDKFNAGLYVFKAFGTATLIVTSLAFAGVMGLRAYFDTDNMVDFNVKMRREIMLRMPLLAKRMRNALGYPTQAEPQSQTPPERPWNPDDAQARLSNAYDTGGLSAWADAAAREIEAEARLEVQHREQLKKFASSGSKAA